MILFCDFNPKIVMSYKSLNFRAHQLNEFTESRIYASGNGIDSLIFLNNLGEKAELLTCLGGVNGKLIKEELDKQFEDFKYVKLKDNNEELVLNKSINLVKKLKSKKNLKTLEEAEKFYSLYSEEIKNKSVVALSCIDEDLDEIGYNSFIDLCYKNNTRVIVACDDLDKIKNSKPYLLIINKNDLEDYTKLIIKTQDETLKAANILLNKGIGSLIINSELGSLFINKSNIFRIDFSDLDKTITKFNPNLMLAAIAFSINRSYDIITSIKIAVASYIIENYTKFRDVNMAEIKKLMNDIDIKKIKWEAKWKILN